MIINKQLSPNLAIQLTNSVEDIEQLRNSSLSDWFKGTYNVLLIHLKPDLYKQFAKNVLGIENFDTEKFIKDFKEKFNKPKKTNQSGRFSR